MFIDAHLCGCVLWTVYLAHCNAIIQTSAGPSVDNRARVLQVVWMLCRKLCHDMIDQHGINRFRPVTGLPISTYFSAFKVKWLLDNVPEVQTAVEEGDAMIGTVDSWLIYNLTGGVGKGVHVTDGGDLTLLATNTLFVCGVHRNLCPFPVQLYLRATVF